VPSRGAAAMATGMAMHRATTATVTHRVTTAIATTRLAGASTERGRTATADGASGARDGPGPLVVDGSR
jgi:hypothetical protein